MKTRFLTIPAALLAVAMAATSLAQIPADPSAAPRQPSAVITHLAVGKVMSVDAAGRRLTIDHQPIQSLNMPAMTMQFRLAPTLVAPKPGQFIAFTFTASSEGLTIGSVQAFSITAPEAQQGRSADDEAMPGMKREGKRGAGGMMTMMESCHAMMGGK
jgi:Cu(I)/Ag(I) efflux system protein CusF